MHPKRREERAKLAATFLNNLGAAAVIGGVIGPLFLGQFDLMRACAGLLVGFALHTLA